MYVNWSNGRCPLKSIPLYPSPSLQIYPSLAFHRYSSLNICPSISLPQDISVDVEAHNLSQEQRVPSAHWLPFPPTRSAARSTPQQWLSARDSWRAGISVRRWGNLICCGVITMESLYRCDHLCAHDHIQPCLPYYTPRLRPAKNLWLLGTTPQQYMLDSRCHSVSMAAWLSSAFFLLKRLHIIMVDACS